MTRIVVDPPELRRGAARLRGLGVELGTTRGRLNGAALPAMPSDLVGSIQAGLDQVSAMLEAIPAPLAESAVELERRALWAEIADELIAGVPLSGALLRQFLDGLRDGSLVRYAEPWQAELAGAYVAGMYADDYKDPAKLIELARLLDANSTWGDPSGAFMAGFVERFGTRIADIPRVIQAMEWTPGMALGGGYDDPFVDYELGMRLNGEGYELDVDPVELLGMFSMALAMGTASGRVSSSVEHDIAWDEDRWAVAQLLHEGHFGANFLKEAFQSVVVSDIQRDAARLLGPDMTAYMQIGAGDNEGPTISTDERELVLRALLRNPEGAALALSTPLPEEVYIASRWAPVETRDPVGILYAADWDDDGELFADLYGSATHWAQSEAGALGTSRQGNEITLQLIERVSNEYRGDLGVVTEALARDLAQHHVRGLLEMDLDDFSDDGEVPKGIVDLTSGRIVLDPRQVEFLVNAIAENEDADRVFLGGLAHGQAAYLAEMVHEHPGDGELWGGRIGTLNQLVLNAHDLDRTMEFGEASDRQKLAMSVVNTTLGALTEGKPYGVLVNPLVTAIDIGTAPSELELANENFAEKLETRELVKALIATAAHEYGAAPGPAPEQRPYLLEDDRLIAYSRDLPPEVRNEFNQWVELARARDERLATAILHALQAMDDHARN